MSYKTWKEEFYPITANYCEEKDALAHSLQKWTGLTKKNLRKHGCSIDRNVMDPYDVSHSIVDKEGINGITINSESCALCQQYGASCENCPLAIARVEHDLSFACDRSRWTEVTSPWDDFTRTGSTRKMLYWLRRAQTEETEAYVAKIAKGQHENNK